MFERQFRKSFHPVHVQLSVQAASEKIVTASTTEIFMSQERKLQGVKSLEPIYLKESLVCNTALRHPKYFCIETEVGFLIFTYM